MEPKDEVALGDPQGIILAKGGRIFIAEQDGVAVGCCALLARGPGELEVGKMTVAETARRGGIGRQMLEKCIAEARRAGAERLYLETNRTLTPAIRLYEGMGFCHVPAERIVPSPYARANVYMELFLDRAV